MPLVTVREETLHSNIETVNSKQFLVLKKHFPQCFDKSGNFIQEKMLEVVNANEVELSKESYTLNWLGKSYARLLTNIPPKTLINEDVAHNELEQNKDSKNLLIKGDNLEVLKHMVNAYSEKVKMIYIDPPYNTGSDGFVYNDDRKFSKEQLADLAGVDLDEATRILEFTDKGSSSHSAWLTFMYPRLYIARELLRDDGVIFISIDDNEVHQLKLLCDEIFGESNFLSQFVVQTNPRGRSLDPYVAKTFEYILCYSKGTGTECLFPIPKSEKGLKEYNKKDSKGSYRLLELRNRNPVFNRDNRPNLYYPLFIDPVTNAVSIEKSDRFNTQALPLNSKNEDGCWTWGKVKVVSENESLFGKKASTGVWRIYRKDYIPESGATTKEKSLWVETNLNHENGKEEVGKLFNVSGNKIPFDFPKSIELIKKCIQIGTKEGDLILDFFAGSGSTAHAVMDINLGNSSNRKFITVQIAEQTKEASNGKKAGYDSIFDITKARITKAAQKIREESPDFQGDLGFKIFETVEDFRVEDDDKELSLMAMTMFDDVMLTDDQYHTLLTTWRLYDGSELTTPVQDIDLDDYTAHLCDNRLYMIASDFSSDALKALLSRLDADKEFSPNKIVFFGKNFDSVKQMELNEALKSYANKKSLEIDLVGRN